LTPKQIEKLVQLRHGDDKVTVQNLAIRFGVSERTIYYYLAAWRRAHQSLAVSMAISGETPS
jgi:DeoR/GlpR family transcriptional regulator of sugar metabolism